MKNETLEALVEKWRDEAAIKNEDRGLGEYLVLGRKMGLNSCVEDLELALKNEHPTND